MRSLDQFRGCLIGGAAGDALGYPVEFMRKRDILRRYGEKGITEYELKGGLALISDDTQMTLFTAAGLLLDAARGGQDAPGAINDAYLDWLKTQELRFPLKTGTYATPLAEKHGLFSRRAPGNTCLFALHSGGGGTPEAPINESKGCGGVMRTAPAGLHFCDTGRTGRDAARLGAQAAALTHGHPLGWMPAGMLSEIVFEICQNGAAVQEAVTRSLDTLEELWPSSHHVRYLSDLIRTALRLAGDGTADGDAVSQLGEGWTGEEALAVAVYCAVRHAGDFDGAVTAAVNHSGDSDSTGAIAGNITGAEVGLSGIPAKYTENLELKELILETADALRRGSWNRITE